MAFLQRYAEKFESVDASQSYTFPLYAYEYEPSQALRPRIAVAVGADYGLDLAGAARWPKDIAAAAVRFEMVGSSTPGALDTDIDSMMSTLLRIGLGKLFTIDNAGTRRWAYAKLDAVPQVTVRIQEWMRQPVSIHFTRLSDWFASSTTTATRTVTASPETFTITNPGNAPVYRAVFRFRANAAAGFTNPQLENLTNGYSFSTTRDSASADSEVRVNTETEVVQYSNDDGATYADDYTNFSQLATQAGMMLLDPGDNSMRLTCGGTPNYDFVHTFYAPYH